MSQEIGLNFKVRIPTFSDNASIEEALKVYHYGVDNYVSQTIPSNSIEGHLSSLNARISATEVTVGSLSQTFIEEVSAVPPNSNRITPINSGVIPLTIRGASGQTAVLQRWESSASVTMASIFPDGSASFAKYVSIGDATQTNTTALRINVGVATDRGIVVRGQLSQSANLQEWQNSSSSALAWVNPSGKIFSSGVETVTLSETQTLTNKTLQNPSISGGSIVNSSVTSASVTMTGGTITNATSITLTGSQNNSSRVRNITFSTATTPSGGNDGDVWIVYG